jgi:hypothetical protein
MRPGLQCRMIFSFSIRSGDGSAREHLGSMYNDHAALAFGDNVIRDMLPDRALFGLDDGCCRRHRMPERGARRETSAPGLQHRFSVGRGLAGRKCHYLAALRMAAAFWVRAGRI